MIWLLLQSTRDADGLPFLPMLTIDEGREPYKVPTQEGRIKLYSWVTALEGVADADLANLVSQAQQIQAERDERYFNAGLLRLAAKRLTQLQAAQQMDELAEQMRAIDDAYRARQEQVQAYLHSLNEMEYAALAAPIEASLKEQVPADKRVLWLPEAWQATVRQHLIRQLLEQGLPQEPHLEQLCA